MFCGVMSRQYWRKLPPHLLTNKVRHYQVRALVAARSLTMFTAMIAVAGYRHNGALCQRCAKLQLKDVFDAEEKAGMEHIQKKVMGELKREAEVADDSLSL